MRSQHGEHLEWWCSYWGHQCLYKPLVEVLWQSCSVWFTLAKVSSTGFVSDATTALDQKVVLSLCSPTLLDALCSSLQTLASKVIQHDNVSASSNSLICLLLGLTFNLNLEGKTTHAASIMNGLCNWSYIPRLIFSRWSWIMCLTWAPDVVVLEHNHGREIHAMGIQTTNKNTIFLDQSKACVWMCVLLTHCHMPSHISRMIKKGKSSYLG